jgi:hypothetical protein
MVIFQDGDIWEDTLKEKKEPTIGKKSSLGSNMPWAEKVTGMSKAKGSEWLEESEWER